MGKKQGVKKEEKNNRPNKKTKQKDSSDIHAPQKVAYPSDHDPKENKWLRIARERDQEKS